MCNRNIICSAKYLKHILVLNFYGTVAFFTWTIIALQRLAADCWSIFFDKPALGSLV